MKTFNNFYEEAISLPNLYRAFEIAKKGKKKRRVLSFEKNLHENLLNLHIELKYKEYKPRPYFTFYVTDYKKRKIMCPDFRDSVVQHAVFNYLEQMYEPYFIYDSYACRVDKGTHKAFKRLKKFVNKHSIVKDQNFSPENFGFPEYSQDAMQRNKSVLDYNNNYFMKCDISKYFYSIDHYKLKEILRKKIKDEDILWLLNSIIDSHYEDEMPSHIKNNEVEKQEKGIPIGNLTSQLLANIYLNELDYFIKHELKAKYYLRYVDDFVILGESYKELKENYLKIKSFLSENLFLKLEEKKVNINKISFGVDFVGYVCFKRMVRVRSRNYRRFTKEFKKKSYLFYNDELTLEKLSDSVLSYIGHISHTNSKKVLENVIYRYYSVIVNKAVKRGGNWNNGANAGPFYANLNNDPTNTNNNIGFRCCSVQEAKIISLRRYYMPYAQMQLHSEIKNENLSRNIADKNSAISAMTL